MTLVGAWPKHPDNWRALTVRRPWSWCIWTGDKLVENRSRGWSYRGALMVHAGAQWSKRGANDPRVVGVWRREHPRDLAPLLGVRDGVHVPLSGLASAAPARVMAAGHVGAVCWVSGSHRAEPGCCDSPWAESTYVDSAGNLRTEVHHLVLEDVERLDLPVPARGRLGLWHPGAGVVAQVVAQL